MPSEHVISLRGAGKCYPPETAPARQLLRALWRQKTPADQAFWALRDVSAGIARGDVVGIVGRNGAGKSTLLQLVAGTLAPSEGSVRVDGRVSALLELGSGFNPDFSGRDNVFLNAAILGLTREETEERFDRIVAFSGIGAFIDNPIRQYSSGMVVRLAFSVATHVDPDILIIDEALSVGDGEFARRSFDRIMAFRDAGKTILFCSHSLYQIEALCNRALWLANGRVQADGEPRDVVKAYDDSLGGGQEFLNEGLPVGWQSSGASDARLLSVQLAVDGRTGTRLEAVSGCSDIEVRTAFRFPAGQPTPSVAVCLVGSDGRIVASASTLNDGHEPMQEAPGQADVRLHLPKLPLLKGCFFIYVYLMCEKGILVLDAAPNAAEIVVSQATLEQGVVRLPHAWEGVVPLGSRHGA